MTMKISPLRDFEAAAAHRADELGFGQIGGRGPPCPGQKSFGAVAEDSKRPSQTSLTGPIAVAGFVSSRSGAWLFIDWIAPLR